MSNENIIREIDDELRSDRVRKAWRLFGPYVIAAAVGIVLIVAAKEGWDWWQGSNAAKSSDQFYSALQLADGADLGAAQKALDEVIASNHGGYPALAQFREAALLGKSGKTAEAIAAYDALSTSQSNVHLREIALILAANLLVDSGDVGQVQQRVGGIIDSASTMRNAAREALGLAKYKAGDLEGARQAFEDVVNDQLASQETRSRLNIYLTQLIAEGVATKPADAAAADAPVVVDPATAAPAESSVGDAPALDTAAPAADTGAMAPAADAPAMAPATDAPAMAPAADAPAMAPATDAPAMAPATTTDAPAAPAN